LAPQLNIHWQKNRIVSAPQYDAGFRKIGERNGFRVDYAVIAIFASQCGGGSPYASLKLESLPRAPSSHTAARKLSHPIASTLLSSLLHVLLRQYKGQPGLRNGDTNFSERIKWRKYSANTVIARSLARYAIADTLCVLEM
jgi:hypothetical protein